MTTVSPFLEKPFAAPLPRTAPVTAGYAPSLRDLVAVTIVPMIAVALRAASSPTANASYFLLAVYSLFGPRQAIVSLYLCWLFNMVNHGIAPIAGGAAIFRHLTIFAAFLSAVVYAGRADRARLRFILPATILFCLFLLLHSALCSLQADVAFLKSVSFSLTTLALMLCWAELSPNQRTLTEYLLFGSLGVIAVASAPLVPLSIGYLRGREGFSGVLVHPQNFGPSMAVLSAGLLAIGLTQKRLQVWKAGMFSVSVFWVYLSRARIAALALVGGVFLGVAFEAIRAALAGRRGRRRVLFSRLLLGAALLGIAMLAAGPFLANKLSDFIQKGSESDSLTEAAFKSRGMLIAEMLANIEKYPATGIGFGVSSELDYYGLARDPIFGLPVMATVEKGVMPIAVAEELGIIGAVFAYAWIALLAFRSVNGGLVTGTVFWSVLVTNVAEACLFSPGGQGMFQLIFAIWACTAYPITMPQPASVAPPLRREA